MPSFGNCHWAAENLWKLRKKLGPNANYFLLTRENIDHITAKIRRTHLAMPGTIVLRCFECISQISRVSPECLADKCRSVWTGAGGNTGDRQGSRYKPLGTTASSLDRQRPVRCRRISAFSRGFPENSAFNSDGTFLSLPGYHGCLVSLGDR